MSDAKSDDDLIGDAVAGNVAALEQLLLIHFPAVERHVEPRIPVNARKVLSTEDVLQEVFVQVFRDIRQCNSRNDMAFFAWLKSIADHRLADAIKHLGRRKRGGDRHQLSRGNLASTSTFASLIDVVCHDSHSPDDSAVRCEMEIAMQVALASLPDAQRDAIRAYYLLNKDIESIARELGRTSGAIRGLIERGKKNLAKAMGRSSRWFSGR